MENRIWKRQIGILALVVLFIGAAAGCPGPETEAESGRERAIRFTERAKDKIAAKQYGEAVGLCLKAEEADDTYDEAKYCIVAANLGAIAKSASSVVGLVSGALAPRDFQPQGLNVKDILQSLVDEIEGQIRYIDVYAYKLAAMENPHFHIDDFPLDFDPSDLIEASGVDEIKVTEKLSLNLRGTWDKSEVMALGAAFNAVQGVLDYLLAHELSLDDTNISFETTGDVAMFLAKNPGLLAGDPDDVWRLEGDDQQKGLKLDVLSALSFLVGRDTDLENVAPANAGLIEAIKQSAKEADPNAVLQWVDKNGDGIPEQIGVPSLEELRDKIVDADGNPLLEDSNFQNFLSEKTWLALIDFGKLMRDNIENEGGEPAPLAAILELIVADLKVDHASTRLLQKKVPDVVALNPGVFFKEPK